MTPETYNYIALIGKGILYFAGSALSLKLLEIVVTFLKNWNAARKTGKQQLTQNQLDLQKLDKMNELDLRKVHRDDFKDIVENYRTIAASAMTREDTANKNCDEEREQRHKLDEDYSKRLTAQGEQITQLEKKVGNIETENKYSKNIIEQLERSINIIYDSNRIAYWVTDQNGNCTINETFFEITGLTGDQCCSDGWLNAVHETQRARISHLWKQFRVHFQTHIEIQFDFVHKVTANLTRVKVECDTVMLNGLEVYKWRARTKPIKLPADQLPAAAH